MSNSIEKDCGGVYAIISPSGSMYVGSARNFNHRWYRHKRDLENKSHHNIHLQRVSDKYGQSNLIYKILLVCSASHLIFYEQRAIDTLSPELNICKVAGNTFGVKPSEETLRKMSAVKIGKKFSPERAYKNGSGFRGKSQSIEHVNKRISSMKKTKSERFCGGYKHSIETKEKQRKAFAKTMESRRGFAIDELLIIKIRSGVIKQKESGISSTHFYRIKRGDCYGIS